MKEEGIALRGRNRGAIASTGVLNRKRHATLDMKADQMEQTEDVHE